MKLAKRVQTLAPSLTFALAERERQLKLAGKEVISLGVGESDLNTPEHILSAAKAAMDQGHTKYTASSGIIELRKAIVDKLARDNNLNYSLNQITVTVGAKQALFNLFQAILDPQDEVIILAPYWVSYIEQVKLAGGVPVIVETTADNEFKATPLQIRDAITKRTKAILINSPSNPTGAIYTREELQNIGNICLENDILIVSDEIYEYLVYDEKYPHVSIASLSEDLYHNTIVINGVSKAYAMTGWRVGYAAGPANIIKSMTDIASQSTSSCASISQYAALAALTGPQEPIHEMHEEFKNRRNFLLEEMRHIPYISYIMPHGAFYLYVDVSTLLARGNFKSVDEFANALLEQEGVSVLPGSVFGSKNYIRISYATTLEKLALAVSKFKKFAESLSEA